MQFRSKLNKNQEVHGTEILIDDKALSADKPQDYVFESDCVLANYFVVKNKKEDDEYQGLLCHSQITWKFEHSITEDQKNLLLVNGVRLLANLVPDSGASPSAKLKS